MIPLGTMTTIVKLNRTSSSVCQSLQLTHRLMIRLEQTRWFKAGDES